MAVETNKILKCALSLLVVLLALPLLSKADEPQYWNQINLKEFQGEKWRGTVNLETRWRGEGDALALYRGSQRFDYAYDPNLDFGFNYTFIATNSKDKQLGEGDFKKQHRFELEVNPHWMLAERWKYAARNRYEYLFSDDFNYAGSRLRHRSTFEYSTSVLGLESFFVATEVFYDIKVEQLNQLRIVPIGARKQLSWTKLSFYPMIQTVYGEGQWDTTGLFVTEFDF